MSPEAKWHIDGPAPLSASVGVPFTVHGWCFIRGQKPAVLKVRGPSGEELPVRSGLPRPDVGRAFANCPEALLSGFRTADFLCFSEEGKAQVIAEADGEHQLVLGTIEITELPAVPMPPKKADIDLRILYVDDRVPDPAAGRGYGRAYEVVRSLSALGHEVSVFGMLNRQFAPSSQPLPGNVEVIPGHGASALLQYLAARPGYFDRMIISRPINFEPFLSLLRFLPRPLIYDAEGIWADMNVMDRERELGLARSADVVLAVSQLERDTFEQSGCRSVVVVSHAQEPCPTPASFRERRGMLFVGALETDSPNADSIRWFASDIAPHLAHLHDSEGTLAVVGPDVAKDLLPLAGPRLRFEGVQPDLASCMNRARIFVAPTRISAGISIKVITAAAFGLPIVATSRLARELGWKHEQDLLVADAPDQFAACCRRLMQDELLWLTLRESALAKVRAGYARDRLRAALAHALAVLSAQTRGGDEPS
jgi:glycosyltransferase involved in cell wall biosynthesis